MTYLDKNLLPDERILFRTKKHLIIFFYPVVVTILAIFATRYFLTNDILNKIDWAPWVIVLIFWGYTAIEYIFSDFAVTNKRVIMREGFFNRHANELRLNTISQISINQSLLGAMLAYGTIIINAFGVTDGFTLIASPDLFTRYVNQELDKLLK